MEDPSFPLLVLKIVTRNKKLMLTKRLTTLLRDIVANVHSAVVISTCTDSETAHKLPHVCILSDYDTCELGFFFGFFLICLMQVW